MAGRKPLPTHLKLVKGTARPHRLNKDEPKPAVAVPEAPALDERTRAKFAAIAEMPYASGGSRLVRRLSLMLSTMPDNGARQSSALSAHWTDRGS
jgi:hypothetical protein